MSEAGLIEKRAFISAFFLFEQVNLTRVVPRVNNARPFRGMGVFLF